MGNVSSRNRHQCSFGCTPDHQNVFGVHCYKRELTNDKLQMHLYFSKEPWDESSIRQAS